MNAKCYQQVNPIIYVVMYAQLHWDAEIHLPMSLTSYFFNEEGTAERAMTFILLAVIGMSVDAFWDTAKISWNSVILDKTHCNYPYLYDHLVCFGHQYAGSFDIHIIFSLVEKFCQKRMETAKEKEYMGKVKLTENRQRKTVITKILSMRAILLAACTTVRARISLPRFSFGVISGTPPVGKRLLLRISDSLLSEAVKDVRRN